MYYLQSRYYDPQVGRFINADSYASTGQGLLGNNMFAYCGNNPINYTDFSGNRFSHISHKAYEVGFSNNDNDNEEERIGLTASVGMSGSACIGGWAYFGQVSIATDADGDSEIQFTYGVSLTTGDPGCSLMFNMTIINAPEVENLHDMCYQLGGTYSGVGLDFVLIPDDERETLYTGVSFSGGIATSDAHFSMSNTFYYVPIKFNLFEFFEDVYNSYWGIGQYEVFP